MGLRAGSAESGEMAGDGKQWGVAWGRRDGQPHVARGGKSIGAAARDRLIGLTRAADGTIYAQLEGSTATLEVSRRNLPGLRKLVRSL